MPTTHSTRNRRTAVRLVVGAAACLALALTGCTATVAGQPVAAPGNPAPPDVSVFQMNRLLLDAPGVNAAAGTSSLRVVKGPLTRMWDDSAVVDNTRCLGVWSPTQRTAYADSGWRLVRGEVLNDATPSGNGAEHSVVQSIVLFPDAEAAQGFFSQSSSTWSACAGATVTSTAADARKQLWTLSDFTDTEDTLTMLQNRQGSDVRCQRALAVRSNITIDTMMCGTDVTDQAAGIAAAIADEMPRV